MYYTKILSHVLQTAQQVWPKFYKENRHLLSPQQTGAYISVVSKVNYESMGTIVGNFNDPETNVFNRARLGEKMMYVGKKTNTLISNGNTTTFPTQNYATKDFGGGTEGDEVLMFCSGLPPQLDHQFNMIVLEKSGQMSAALYERIMHEFDTYKDQRKPA